MKKFAILGCILMMLFAFSCNQESALDRENANLEVMGTKAEITTDFDRAADGLAVAIHNAVKNNVEFRKLLKEEALLQFDGDYDILLKRFYDKAITPSDPEVMTRAGGGSMMVGDFLDMYFPEGIIQTRGNASIIEMLQSEYPYLQISIPVHAEMWDPESEEIPPLAITVENYIDGETDWVPGYDADGNSIWVDAKNEPTVPYIVIGQNERVDANGDPIDRFDDPALIYPVDDAIWKDRPLDPLDPIDPPVVPATPNAPTGLTAVSQNNGITLSWNYSSGATKYYIYRKGPSQSDFSQLTTVNGIYNTAYTDNSNLISGMYYYYYVIAVASNLYYNIASLPSSTVYAQAANVPNGPAAFKAGMHGTSVELTWNNNGDTQSQTKLERSVPAYSPTWSNIVTLSGTVREYTHTPPARGEQVKYRAAKINNAGQSDYVYDYIYPPYRNTGALSPVYIKQVKVSLSAEGWLAGKPEVYVKVIGVRNNTAYDIQREMNFEFNSRSSTSQVFTNRKVMDWYYDANGAAWYDTIYFSMEEYDRPSGSWTVSFTLKGTVKLFEILGFEAGVNVSRTFSNKGEYCGESMYRYFEPDNGWVITFPNYGAKLYLNTTP